MIQFRPLGLRGMWVMATLVLGLPFHPLAKGAAWEPTGISGGGAMFSPAISPLVPDLMMLNCDMSAAYISEDGGHQWRMIHYAQLRSDIYCRPAFHPTDSNTIFASSNGRLKVSHDRGRTFSNLGSLNESLAGEIAINPDEPSIMLAGSQRGRALLSKDAGATWTTCAGPTGKVIAFHFLRDTKSTPYFAATSEGIWRSTDKGLTWVGKTQGLPWKEIQGFAGGSNLKGKQSILYCTVRTHLENSSFKGGVYLSRDGGETWHSATGTGLNTETIKADPWAHGDVSQYEQILTTDANPSIVYVFNTSTGFNPPHSDTVYLSDDAGDHWHPVYFQDPRFKDYNVSPDWETASCGKSFKGGETPFGVAICNSYPNRVMLVRNEPHITHDGGNQWFGGHTLSAPGEKPGPFSNWLCNGLVVTTTWHFYTDPFETNRQYICYTDIGMARSTNGGKSWIWWEPKSWSPWRNTCYEMAFDPSTPGKMWGAFSDVHDIPNDNIISERHGHRGPGGVCLSLDFGKTWKSQTVGLPAKAVTSIVVDPKSSNNARTLYAGVFELGIFKSLNDGKNWSLKSSGLGHPDNMRVNRVFLHRDGTLFAAICARRSAAGQPLLPEGVGLYRSKDGAESWAKVNASKTFLYPKDFSVDPADSSRILVGTADAGQGDQSGGLYLTKDGGQTWKRIGRQGSQTFGGYFHPNHPGWIYMTLTEGAPGAGLWLSKDDGISWQAFEDLPFSNIQRVEFSPSPSTVIHVTTFGGSVWTGPETP